MIKKVVFAFLLTISLVSCKVVQTPIFVSSGELASLTIGMGKEDVKSKLQGTAPFDILSSKPGNCEVHHYKYKTPAKSIVGWKLDKQEGLTEGEKVFVVGKSEDAYVVFREGKLESLLTNAGKSDLVDLLESTEDVMKICSEAGLRGCTNPDATNFDKSAIINDGTCEFCPCGTIKNPSYDKLKVVSDCNVKCLKDPSMKSKEDANSAKSGANTNDENSKNELECTNCDLIEKLANSKATVNVNLVLPENNQKKAKTKSTKTTVKAEKNNTPGFFSRFNK